MSVFKTEHCRDCGYASLCKGGCLADVYGRTGAFSCHDEYKCMAMEMTKDYVIPVEWRTRVPILFQWRSEPIRFFRSFHV